MKVSQMIGRCGALALVATLLGAQAAEQKTIKVVGLEDDKDNATVVAPPELARKLAEAGQIAKRHGIFIRERGFNKISIANQIRYQN